VGLLNLVLAKMDAASATAAPQEAEGEGKEGSSSKDQRAKFSAALADTLAVAYMQVRALD
jgi:hypothetical protein